MSIDGSESITGTGMIGENEQEKKMQVCKATFLYKNLFLLAFLSPFMDASKRDLTTFLGKSYHFRKTVYNIPALLAQLIEHCPDKPRLQV